MAESAIKRDPNILGGTPVFSGTRVPVRILWDHLEASIRLDEFLDDYPTVSREQAIAVLESAASMLIGNECECTARWISSKTSRAIFPDGFDVHVVQDMGWSGRADGELLQLAESHLFDLLVTADKGFQFQQNLEFLPVPVIIMIAPRIQFRELRRLVPKAVSVPSSKPKPDIFHVPAWGDIHKQTIQLELFEKKPAVLQAPAFSAISERLNSKRDDLPSVKS